eukprot:11947899-Alexandrium_andersonii.AAC.1
MARANGRREFELQLLRLNGLLLRPFDKVYRHFQHRQLQGMGAQGPISIYQPGSQWLLLKWLGQRGTP